MMDFDEINLIPLQPITDPVGPKRAKRSDAVANRELILATARRLFAERGISQVCMATIAEAAGVGKGTLYRGFANKGELCLALLDQEMRDFQNRTLQMLRETYQQPALSRLDAFLDRLVHFTESQAPLLREIQRQGVLHSAAAASHASPNMWLPWLQATVGILLQQAQQNGETTELDIPYLIDAILAPLNADLFTYQREVLGFDLERISAGFRRLVLTGIKT